MNWFIQNTTKNIFINLEITVNSFYRLVKE